MNFGRYQIVSELGRGSMGVVYLAYDPQINRQIALKALREDRLTSDDYVQRFLKEAKAIGRLSHSAIVTVYDVGQDHGTVYIAMEFLEGRPLDQVGSSLQLQDIINVGVQIAQALHYAHEKGIVHRDIKPPNIIYTEEGTIKVTDFGIAHIDDPDGQEVTRAGEILGTPVYMSPEQVLGRPVDGRTDLYSLGVILYELTTGERPFQGENLAAVFRAITNDDPIAPHRLNSDIPPVLSRLILKTMARNPEDRIATGRELAELLKQSLNSTVRTPAFQTVFEKLSSTLPLILIATFLLTGVGLTVYLYLRPAVKETPSHLPTNTEQEKNPVGKLAILKINSHPDGAGLYLNGEYQGMTPVELETTATKHEVKLELQGYLDWKAQLDLSKGGEIPLSVRLLQK